MRTLSPYLLGIVVVGLSASALAQPTPAPTPIQPVQPQVKPLTLRVPGDLGVKRVSVYNQALAKAGFPTLSIPPPPAYSRVTPADPASGGARITTVGKSVYVGPSPERPDGIFVIDAPPPPPPSGPGFNIPLPGMPRQPLPPPPAISVSAGTLSIEFTAEGNKTYFVDCRVSPAQSYPATTTPPKEVTFSRSGTAVTQQVAPEEGHFVYPFRTAAGILIAQKITLKVAQDSYFYSCEITKVDAPSK